MCVGIHIPCARTRGLSQGPSPAGAQEGTCEDFLSEGGTYTGERGDKNGRCVDFFTEQRHDSREADSHFTDFM